MLPELEEIKKQRKALGLTQKQLAILAKVSQSLIAKLETNRIDPSYDNVRRIVTALEQEEKSKTKIGKIKNIQNTTIISIDKSDSVLKAIQLMNKHAYSQLPVVDKETVVGSISENDITSFISKEKNLESLSKRQVSDLMAEEFPRVSENSPLESVVSLLKYSPAVLTTRKGKIIGIITKADLFKILQKS